MKFSTPRYRDELAPWRALAAAIIIQALQEARRNRPCTCPAAGPHRCGPHALAFLHSQDCAALLRLLDLPLQPWPALLAQLDRLEQLDARRTPRFDARRLKHSPSQGPGYGTGFDGLFPRPHKKGGNNL